MGRQRFVYAALGAAVAIVAGIAMAQAQAPAAQAPSADLGHGKQVFSLCAQCHGTDARGNPRIGAPSISGLDSWYVEEQLRKFKSGMRGRHPDDHAGLRMRPMALTLENDQDITAVAAYVGSLERFKPAASLAGGDPAKGQQYFMAICSACHGLDGSGSIAQKAPPLNRASDWYLVQQLKNFKGGVRGTNPKDSFGLTMAPMAQQLPDEQAMLDVVAFVTTRLGAPAQPR